MTEVVYLPGALGVGAEVFTDVAANEFVGAVFDGDRGEAFGRNLEFVEPLGEVGPNLAGTGFAFEDVSGAVWVDAGEEGFVGTEAVDGDRAVDPSPFIVLDGGEEFGDRFVGGEDAFGGAFG